MRLGEREPAELTTPPIAVLVITLATRAGVADGSAASTSAAAPATCGAAMEVPLIVLVAVLALNHAEVIEEPGANRSRQGP
jgi:hypothetical protein